MADDTRRAVRRGIGRGVQPIGVHHLDDQLGALLQADILRADARLLHKALQIGDGFIAVGVDPVKDLLQVRV